MWSILAKADVVVSCPPSKKVLRAVVTQSEYMRLLQLDGEPVLYIPD